MPKGLIDGGHGTTSHVSFSSSVKSYASIAFFFLQEWKKKKHKK